MSSFVSNKMYLWGIKLLCFIQKKSSAEAQIIFVETYNESVLLKMPYRDWFRHFKNNNFELEIEKHSGTLKKFEDKELEEVLD